MRKLSVLSQLIVLCLFLSPQDGKSQTIVYYYTQKIDTLLSLSAQPGVKKINAYFPAASDMPQLQKGVLLSNNSRCTTTKPYVTAANDSLRKFVISARYNTENISRIKFTLLHDQDSFLIKEVVLKNDGLQSPLYQSIENLKTAFTGHPCTLQINYELKDASRPGSLVAGDIWIGNVIYEKKPSPARYFRQLPFENARIPGKGGLSKFDSYNVYTYFPKDENEEDFKGSLLIEDRSKPTQQLLSEIMISLLRSYPFYKERQLNKNDIIQAATLLLKKNKSASVCELVDTLNEFLLTKIQDPHFVIRSKCHSEVYRTPVYTYRINGKICIAAVVDNELVSKIPLAAEVLSINNTPINPALLTDKKIDGMLRRSVNDSVWLTLRCSGDSIHTIGYRIKSNYAGIQSYKPANFDFRIFNDSIAYYRISQMSAELPLDFLNKTDSIRHTKKLIIDLRGNGGGDFFAAAQFASFFMTGTFTYFNTISNTSHKRDSVLISNKADRQLLPNGKIIILIDNNTACVAELLAKVLKMKYPKALIIGKESSRGAIAFTQELRLPKDNISIITNSMNTIKVQFNRSSIEGTGLSPDILVHIGSVEDLQPYHDKVLLTAISK